MKFTLTRYSADDGPGVFAAFADRTELPLGDLRGDLTPEILRTWAAAVLAHLFGPDIAEQFAGRLAESQLMAPDLQLPIDWEAELLVLNQSDVVSFVLAQAA